jgi:hypothetical protein
MPAKMIHNSLPNEALVGIDPELLARVEVNWQHRLSLFTGRVLTESAFKREQANHSGLLALTGQLVSPGVTQGLRAVLDLSGERPACHVQPGSGITADGEDVHLATPLRAALADLAVAVNGEMLEDTTFEKFQQASNSDFAGVLVLQPVVVSRADNRTGDNQPSFITDSCQTDPGSYAFEDWQLLDGSRLVFHAWPKDFLELPSAGPNWRNRIAYAIYERESRFEMGDSFPWANVGLPLAVLGFDDKWSPLFIDRYAVVRTGGYPRRRSSSANPLDIRVEGGEFAAPYNLFLAEARIHQFAEELSETTPNTVAKQLGETKPKPLAEQFSFLPPVGVVPVSAVQLRERRNVSFPQQFHITARPVHINELDGLILASANSAPINFGQSEEVELLAPLPDGVYDPRLLFVEEVSPEFQKEVDESREKRNETLRHRKDLQTKANALLKVLGLPSISNDQDVSKEEASAFDVAYTAPDSEAFGTQHDKDSGTVVSSDLEALRSTARSAPYTVTVPVTDVSGKETDKKRDVAILSKKELDDIETTGLENFINTLQHRVNAANDLVDLAFLRTHTDIYRYRQHMMNSADATRLATSPILAQIAQSSSVNATKTELQKFIEDARKTASAPAPPQAPALPSYRQAATHAVPIFSTGGLSVAIGAKLPVARAVQHSTPPRPVTHTVKVAPKTHAAMPVATRIPKVVVPPAPHPAAPAHPTAVPVKMPLAPPAIRFLGAAGGLIPAVRPPVAAGPKTTTLTSTDIHQDAPVIGAQLNFRTVSVARRLQDPPSQEALFYATSNRMEMTELLYDLELRIDDLPLIVDLGEEKDENGVFKLQSAQWTVGDLKSIEHRAQIFGQMLAPVIKPNADESHLFSVGVRVLEQHTALLRALEARIQLYHNFIQYARSVLKIIQDELTALDSHLKQLEDDLSSARHDLAFATALLAEETQRVEGVNAKRAEVIQQYVTYLIFRRPPAVPDSIKLPTRPLNPALASSPVPACLGGRSGAPPELHDMLALLREAPVAWIPEMLALITRFNRPFLLQQLATTVRERAMVRQSAAPHTSYAQTQTGALATAMSTLYLKHQIVMSNYRTARVYFEPSILESETWLTQHGYMQRLASIGDLLESHYAAPAVTRAAANLFQQIGTVAGCLYQRVGSVAPLTRLRWAEQLADIHAHTDLHDLAVLPTWSEVDYVLRRELQGYVDWLFARLQPSISEAAGYMSDLVRVCILLASHAPVDEIIHGEVISKAPLVSGGVIKVSATSPRIYHGMQVLLYDHKMQVAAHGTVADLSNAETAVQVVNVLKPGGTSSPQYHAQFVSTSIPLHGAPHPLR